jgi:uncharacterized protein
VILVDTGPLVALFEPRDDAHGETRSRLARLRDELVTTVPVLTEAFHLLGPSTKGARALRSFLTRRGLRVWWLSAGTLSRALRLMDDYTDQEMDLADASLVAAAEALRTTKIFTIDRRDFSIYRAKVGRSLRSFSLV